MAGHPPVNQLHVWWARRPLITSRAAILASVLDGDTYYDQFVTLIGTSRQIVEDRRNMDYAKSKGEWSDFKFSGDRAFKHNLTSQQRKFVQQRIVQDNPLVLDVTTGGGSIPFEAGRLGLRSIANELNPVAAFILRATC